MILTFTFLFTDETYIYVVVIVFFHFWVAMLLISVIKLFDVQVYPKINGGKVRNREKNFCKSMTWQSGLIYAQRRRVDQNFLFTG